MRIFVYYLSRFQNQLVALDSSFHFTNPLTYFPVKKYQNNKHLKSLHCLLGKSEKQGWDAAKVAEMLWKWKWDSYLLFLKKFNVL